MRIEFLKMQGLGNDFMVFDAPPVNAKDLISSDTLRALSDRHTGVGFDQALILEAARHAQNRVYYRVFNADGTEVEQCGNGARCVAALMHARQPELGRDLTLESGAGTVRARVGDDGLVGVEMGIPNFEPGALGLDAPCEMPVYSLIIGGVQVDFGAVSMGNPHAVLSVDDVSVAPVAELGPAIEHHPSFTRRTNVGFMQVVDRRRIRLRVYERGAGETRACGTGACAAVAVGRRWGLLDSNVRVDLPGGTAMVEWQGPGRPVWLTGPATLVYSGSIDIQRDLGAEQ
jgi:diaminopimelate epimerase